MARTLLSRIENHLLEKTDGVFVPARAARLPLDVDTLYRMRVASRRLREGLRYFADLFPAAETRQLRRQLRRLTTALGLIRTLDVNLQLLRQAGRRLPATALAAQSRLIACGLSQRAEHVRALRELLVSLRTAHVEERLRALVMQARPLDEARILKAARVAVRARHDKVRRRWKKYRQHPSTRAFHRLRIAVKQYRYALETTVAVFGSSENRLGPLETLQGLLGECHDLEVLRQWIEQTCDEKKFSAKTGKLLEYLESAEAAARQQLDAWLAENRQWLKKPKVKWPAA
jgi:CHAD domain-containing protein